MYHIYPRNRARAPAATPELHRLAAANDAHIYLYMIYPRNRARSSSATPERNRLAAANDVHTVSIYIFVCTQSCCPFSLPYIIV